MQHSEKFFGTVMIFSQTNNIQNDLGNFIYTTKSLSDGKVIPPLKKTLKPDNLYLFWWNSYLV